ncbi:tagaturonate reductase [Cnuella takakiae]|uniref:Tagaturonate reductase n=1 Tax=Cnuella takakiae TaxID=1302690 RepID=A0A1M5A2M7_9BACT|nr:tagaturonate reductase [Cnuella takakiae]OLY92119.1 altronate oxidoreductase [Cnuella takakiae]SHF24485.1 tagaturonate reductase [Cnuella takakiae]
MVLSRFTLKNINPEAVSLPPDTVYELPEKVLQFGTGVLLRGLPDFFIDKANRKGVFNGRIVVVKSTAQGDTSAFDKQDGMYTVCVRGVQEGQQVSENIINASISRVLNAAEEWEQVLECAQNPELQIIISNTTEVGIELVNDDVRHHPPKSYPGKLLAFLLARYRVFRGSPDSGMVILPTELIPNNGKKLESIVLELAHLNGLEEPFIEWLEQHNHFCSTLVDRIVPGKPDAATFEALEKELGYSDELLTMSEVYSLWAIEGGDAVREKLSFAAGEESIIITEDIDLHRELKLRLLNGTHTLSCGLAFLAGCTTVQDAMNDASVSTYIEQVMQQEIAPAIPYTLPLEQAQAFGNKVLDRFRNPAIRHLWLSITMNYSSKMKMRCVPVLLRHYEQSSEVPQLLALGFAAYLAFSKPVETKGGKYYGRFNEETYLIQDDQAPQFYRRWNGLTPAALVKEVLSDATYWGHDLGSLPGFADAVLERLGRIQEDGMREILELTLNNKSVTA